MTTRVPVDQAAKAAPARLDTASALPKVPAPVPMPPAPSRSRTSPPLYRQIERYLLEQIESETLQPGDMLPSVKDLCAQFGGINHLTVRQAIGNLAKRKLVRSVQGRGTFVTELYERRSDANRVALVLPHLDTHLSASIARGVQRVIQGAGLRTVILDSQHDFKNEVDNVHHLKDLSLEGAIIFPTPFATINEEIIHLKLDKFPFVLVDRALRDVETPAVVVDNYKGSYDLTRCLIDKGHQCIAWIGELKVTTAQDRMTACRDALNDAGLVSHRSLFRDAGLELSPAPVASGRWSFEILIEELINATPRPDAIICGNDTTALICLRLLKQMNVKVPDEIAVAGFDDLPEAAHSEPPLTTVRQPMQQVGEEAAKMLLQQLSGKHAPIRKLVLPVELVVRDSA
jgi:GntR family transcriptional regulator of arabinose operon